MATTGMTRGTLSVARPSLIRSSRRRLHTRAQQQDEKREMPRGVDFEYDTSNEIPEKDIWDGEQWEVCSIVLGTIAFLCSSTL